MRARNKRLACDDADLKCFLFWYIIKEMKCKKCLTETITKKHTFIKTKWLKGNCNYAFSQWEYCPNCSTVFHDEKYKVSVEEIISQFGGKNGSKTQPKEQTNLMDFICT